MTDTDISLNKTLAKWECSMKFKFTLLDFTIYTI